MNTNGSYTTRLATLEDAAVVAPLFWRFVCARVEADPSLRLKSQCDIQRFVERDVFAQGTFCWLAEHSSKETATPTVVGCLVWYLEEEPDDELSPFEPRRCAKVLGLYVEPSHRSSCVALLVDKAIAHSQSLQITDIDVLISAEQKGLHAMVQERGFRPAASQFTRSFAPQPKWPLATERAAPTERSTRFGHHFLDPAKS